jgi:hypothetical protein
VYGNGYVTETWNLQSPTPQYNARRSLGTYLYWEDDLQNSSVNTPGYRKNKPKILPDYPHSRRIALWRNGWTSVNHWFLYANGRLDKNLYEGPITLYGGNVDENHIQYPGDDPTNQALARLHQELSLSKGSLGVGIAEAGKTAQHLANTATRLVTAYRNLRKGRLGDFARDLGLTVQGREVRAFRNRYLRKQKFDSNVAQFAAQSWLEYSYAWKPLLSDMYAQAENLATYLTEHSYVVREARASAKTERTYFETVNQSSLLWKTTKRVKVMNRRSYVVRYRIPEGAKTVANVFGLENPALIAWELVPFSFVADWFLPIGSFLEGLTAYRGLEFAGGTTTWTRRANIECTISLLGGSGTNPRQWTDNLKPEVATNQIVGKTRDVLTSFPEPRLPEFKDPRSFAHAASAISLIQSVFKGDAERITRVVR